MEYSSIYTIFILFIYLFLASLVAQKVKHPPAMWETGVQSLGWEDFLEKRLAAHSSILAWRILWTEEPGGLQSMGSQRVRHSCATNTHKQPSEDEHWWDGDLLMEKVGRYPCQGMR